MNVSVSLNEADSALVTKYAEIHGISVAELFRQAVLERIEDEYDLQAYEQAMKEYQANPVTYTHEEVGKMLGLAE
ncbi:MAG: ribbon-helix-helix protein, CopG family [Oscillibacter sp.]|nr:ribbon-helix-helix protein, CopG family [Oscillibacter sp.]